MEFVQWKNKKILVLGLGKEGIDNFEFLRKMFPAKVLGLADQLILKELPSKTRQKLKKDRKTKLHLGKDHLSFLKNYEVIIKTPGVPLKKIKPHLKTGQILTSQTEIFLKNCPGKIIGITGTKGKGTTASLLYRILKQAGLKVNLIGNIGQPVLSYLLPAKKDSIFIYELSSHQLQNLKISPTIAVFLNLYPAHLDHFKNLKDYYQAKQSIFLFQKKDDYFIFNRDQKELKDLAKKNKARKIRFGLKAGDCSLKNGWLVYKGKNVTRITDLALKGNFLAYNLMAAVCVAKLLGVSNQKIKKAVKDFKPLPHRLELIGKFKGIEFYNDSLATIPESAILAIEALKPGVETIMLGGHETNQYFKKLIETIFKAKIKNIIFFPPNGQRIYQEMQKLKNSQKPRYFFVENMAQAVRIAFTYTNQNGVCLMSPAAPSFGIFKDYKDRGEQFKKYVKYYAKKNARKKN